MTDRLSTLTRLRDMVRNAEGPDVDLDTRTAPHLADYGGSVTASVDACLDRADLMFPGCKIALADVGQRHTAHIKWEGLEAAAYGNTRPLAILDCLLSVLIEKEGRE